MFMTLKDEIKLVLSYEYSKSKWRNKHSSEEFILACKVGSAVGSPINRSRNCGCIEDLFMVLKIMSKEKVKLKQTQMGSKFKLKEGVCPFWGKRHMHLTNANLTDKLAKEFLKDYPTLISIFETVPKDFGKKKTRAKKVVEVQSPEQVEEVLETPKEK